MFEIVAGASMLACVAGFIVGFCVNAKMAAKNGNSRRPGTEKKRAKAFFCIY